MNPPTFEQLAHLLALTAHTVLQASYDDPINQHQTDTLPTLFTRELNALNGNE